MPKSSVSGCQFTIPYSLIRSSLKVLVVATIHFLRVFAVPFSGLCRLTSHESFFWRSFRRPPLSCVRCRSTRRSWRRPGQLIFFKKRFSLKTILLSRESYGKLNYPKLGICIFMVGLTSRVFAIAEATMTGGHKNQPTTTTRRRRRRRRTTTTTSHNQQNLLWPCEILKTDAFIGYISKMYLSKKGR